MSSAKVTVPIRSDGASEPSRRIVDGRRLAVYRDDPSISAASITEPLDKHQSDVVDGILLDKDYVPAMTVELPKVNQSDSLPSDTDSSKSSLNYENPNEAKDVPPSVPNEGVVDDPSSLNLVKSPHLTPWTLQSRTDQPSRQQAHSHAGTPKTPRKNEYTNVELDNAKRATSPPGRGNPDMIPGPSILRSGSSFSKPGVTIREAENFTFTPADDESAHEYDDTVEYRKNRGRVPRRNIPNSSSDSGYGKSQTSSGASSSRWDSQGSARSTSSTSSSTFKKTRSEVICIGSADGNCKIERTDSQFSFYNCEVKIIQYDNADVSDYDLIQKQLSFVGNKRKSSTSIDGFGEIKKNMMTVPSERNGGPVHIINNSDTNLKGNERSPGRTGSNARPVTMVTPDIRGPCDTPSEAESEGPLKFENVPEDDESAETKQRQLNLGLRDSRVWRTTPCLNLGGSPTNNGQYDSSCFFQASGKSRSPPAFPARSPCIRRSQSEGHLPEDVYQQLTTLDDTLRYQRRPTVPTNPVYTSLQNVNMPPLAEPEPRRRKKTKKNIRKRFLKLFGKHTKSDDYENTGGVNRSAEGARESDERTSSQASSSYDGSDEMSNPLSRDSAPSGDSDNRGSGSSLSPVSTLPAPAPPPGRGTSRGPLTRDNWQRQLMVRRRGPGSVGSDSTDSRVSERRPKLRGKLRSQHRPTPRNTNPRSEIHIPPPDYDMEPNCNFYRQSEPNPFRARSIDSFRSHASSAVYLEPIFHRSTWNARGPTNNRNTVWSERDSKTTRNNMFDGFSDKNRPKNNIPRQTASKWQRRQGFFEE